MNLRDLTPTMYLTEFFTENRDGKLSRHIHITRGHSETHGIIRSHCESKTKHFWYDRRQYINTKGRTGKNEFITNISQGFYDLKQRYYREYHDAYKERYDKSGRSV